jgi:hypothetical protein
LITKRLRRECKAPFCEQRNASRSVSWARGGVIAEGQSNRTATGSLCRGASAPANRLGPRPEGLTGTGHVPGRGFSEARPWGLAREEEKLSSPEKDLDESFGLFIEGN